MVLIPRDKHGEADCFKAKETELTKLIDFDVYTEVDDARSTMYFNHLGINR